MDIKAIQAKEKEIKEYFNLKNTLTTLKKMEGEPELSVNVWGRNGGGAGMDVSGAYKTGVMEVLSAKIQDRVDELEADLAQF